MNRTYTLAEVMTVTGLQFDNYDLAWAGQTISGIWNNVGASSSEITYLTSPGPTRARFTIVSDQSHTIGQPTTPLVYPSPRYAAAKIASLWAVESSRREVLNAGRSNVYDCVVFGSDVKLWPGVTLGADGFGFEWDSVKREYFKFPHLGLVVIGDHVEIQSNSNVDRGTLSNTIVGSGTKIDSNVHVAHNCRIGENVMLTAGVVLGGSVTIGDGAWLGLNASVMQGVTIGEGATIGVGTTVLRDVAPRETVVGIHRVIDSKDNQLGVIR